MIPPTTNETRYEQTPEQKSLVGRLLGFCIYNKLVVGLMALFLVAWGVYVAPFDWDFKYFPRNAVPVDAIPDIGENQQIVFTEWPGRSPQDVEDQITYPLTTSLLGIPDIKTIRSSSMFGFSSIYIIFKDFSAYERLLQGRNFYWTRSRVLEKLSSLPASTLPAGVQPMLGPDATALGQIFWYTLEGRDPDGNVTGGWDLEELRTIQDWQVRPALRSSLGVSEVASAGGFVREYQVDVDPDAMRAYNVTIEDVFDAVRQSNIDVGAQTIELNRVEYLIRGIGFIKKIADIDNSVIKTSDNVPILVKNVAKVTLGPEARRGALDKEGAEAVGGVVVARYGSNPLAVIKDVKKKIAQLAPALSAKAVIDHSAVTPEQLQEFAGRHGFEVYDGAELNQPAWLDYLRKAPQNHRPGWLTKSQVTIIPFYDRSGLIYETLGTLNDALYQEILVTVIVIIIMVMHLRSSVLISSVMPLAVLGSFIAMKTFGVDANIVSLSGIAIAIGTIVDMGIVICENILRHLEEDPPDMPRAEVIHRAASEVGSAVLSAVASTIISFLPVFAMSGPEGKLFKPLAFTKTFALFASIVIALTIIPPAAHIFFFPRKIHRRYLRIILYACIGIVGMSLGFRFGWLVGIAIVGF
ncbi:MAG: efflux RND transporter permease subunit, partial [Sedimentisphaerales bacterium]|nr:efflux RND transporter permease subunit [Sedimentisphaerales bacterium]